MFAHPLITSVLLADGLALVLLGPAAWAAMRVVLGWAPERNDAAQLRLEVQAESASVLARYATLCLLAGSLCLLIAITVVLPEVVPGAMCGTGVIQAMGGLGHRVVALRGLSIALLVSWQLIDRLNRSHPLAPLTGVSARGLLLATPFVVLTVIDTMRALWAVDLSQPVDCCAVIYDQARPRLNALGEGLLTGRQWLAISGIGSLMLVALALVSRRRGLGSTAMSTTIFVLAIAWAPATAIALTQVLAAYHYGVLHHHCPWCLFLTDHYWVGYPLFGAIIVVVLEALSMALATRLAANHAAIAAAARTRARVATLRLLVGALLFWAVAGLPALVWRLRFGLWMG
jgi:hypothetical protein